MEEINPKMHVVQFNGMSDHFILIIFAHSNEQQVPSESGLNSRDTGETPTKSWTKHGTSGNVWKYELATEYSNWLTIFSIHSLLELHARRIRSYGSWPGRLCKIHGRIWWRLYRVSRSRTSDTRKPGMKQSFCEPRELSMCSAWTSFANRCTETTMKTRKTDTGHRGWMIMPSPRRFISVSSLASKRWVRTD
jgi:hypothetical protein